MHDERIWGVKLDDMMPKIIKACEAMRILSASCILQSYLVDIDRVDDLIPLPVLWNRVHSLLETSTNEKAGWGLGRRTLFN